VVGAQAQNASGQPSTGQPAAGQPSAVQPPAVQPPAEQTPATGQTGGQTDGPPTAPSGDPPPTGDPVAAPPPRDPELENPRIAVQTFIESVRLNEQQRAIKCLDLSKLDKQTRDRRGWPLAYDLKSIIDKIGPFTRYDLIPLRQDSTEPISLQQMLPDLSSRPLAARSAAEKIVMAPDAGGNWRFTAQSVAEIDALREALEMAPAVTAAPPSLADVPPEVWLREQFPPQLRTTRFLLPDYQWFCLLVLIFLGFVVDIVVRTVFTWLAARWDAYFQTDQKMELDKKARRPLGLLAQATLWWQGIGYLGLPILPSMIILAGLKMFLAAASVWAAFALIDILAAFLAAKASHTHTKFDDLLVPLVSRSLKAFAICVGILAVAEAFDLPIMGLLGGLSIGGLALAIAAKDAVANFFGSLTVLVDRPFEIGDWIKTTEIEGSVESVGFRSTRIRTFHNSQIIVPNSLLTTAIVDNMGRRRYRRIKLTIAIQYNTPPDRIEAFCEGIRELIRRHPYMRKDSYQVNLNDLLDNALGVLLYCFIECPDWSMELEARHRLLLDIVRLAGAMGVEFAFPTRTLHLYNEQRPKSPPPFEAPEEAGRTYATRIFEGVFADAGDERTNGHNGPA
jgi:MscS family membrane protein